MNSYIYSLILQTKEGDPKAFEQLYIKYKDPVYALASATTKSVGKAEEATRQTFIQAFRQIGSLRDANIFDLWILYIAINESNALMQRSKPSEEKSPGRYDEGFEDDFLMPRDYIERDDLSYRLRMIIDGLPRIRRQTLLLALYDKRSPAEIAQITDCAEDEVILRLRRTKYQIKTELEDRERETGERFSRSELIPFDNVYSFLIHSRGMSAEEAADIWKQIQESLSSEKDNANQSKLSFGVKAAIAASVATIVICVGILGIILTGPTFSAKKADTKGVAEATAAEAPTAAPATAAPVGDGTSPAAESPATKSPAAPAESSSSQSEEPAATASNNDSELLSMISGNYYMPQMAGYTHVSLAIENGTVTQSVVSRGADSFDKSESGEIASVSAISDTVIRYESSSGDAFSGTYYSADTPTSQVPSLTMEYLSGFNRYDFSDGTLGITIVVDDQNTCYVRNS